MKCRKFGIKPNECCLNCMDRFNKNNNCYKKECAGCPMGNKQRGMACYLPLSRALRINDFETVYNILTEYARLKIKGAIPSVYADLMISKIKSERELNRDINFNEHYDHVSSAWDGYI